MDDLGDSASLDLDADDKIFNDGFSDLEDEEMNGPVGVEEHMVDSFVLAGADRIDAKLHVKALMRSSPQQKKLLTTFMEVFGGGAICQGPMSAGEN